MCECTWKNIENAPKDRKILVGHFRKGSKWDGLQAVDWWREEYDGWGHFNVSYFPATHWATLPEPPK